jgi:hypothetical protein
MRENFCPAICAACPVFVFDECAALKAGDWTIFGDGVQPRICMLPRRETKTSKETSLWESI